MSRTFLIFFNFVNENHSHLAAPIIPHKMMFVNTCANKNICFCNDWSNMQSRRKAPKNGQVGADCNIGCAIKCKTEVKK